MKSEWSSQWKSSVQPRKQRKFRANAPLHVRHSFLSAHLAPELRSTYGRRSMPVRRGDEVQLMRGPQKGIRKAVERVDLHKARVYLNDYKVKKVNGTEVLKPVQPSNLMITKLALDDKARLAAVQRGKSGAKPVEAKKPKTESAKPKAEAKPEKLKPETPGATEN